MQRQTFTVAEAAVVLGISRSKAYELVAGGAIRTLPVESRRRLIPRAALEELLGGPIEAPSIKPHDQNATHSVAEPASSSPTSPHPELLATLTQAKREGYDPCAYCLTGSTR